MAGEPCSYWMQCTLLASFIYIGWWAMSWLHACYSNLCSSYLVNVLISGWVPQLNSKCMFQIFFYLKNSCHVGQNLESKLKNVQFVQNLPLIGCTSLKAWWKLVCMLTLLWWVLDCFKHNFNWAMHPSSFRATQTDAMPWPSESFTIMLDKFKFPLSLLVFSKLIWIKRRHEYILVLHEFIAIF